MSKISKKRLEKYRKLADKDLWDIKNEKINAFYSRARSEGLKAVNPDPGTVGMFLAPYRKELTDVDIALVGIPLDLGVPNPRPGTRLGPEEVRKWSVDREITNYSTGVMPFELCSVIDWGDVEFTLDVYSLDSCLDQIYRDFKMFSKAGVATLAIGGEHTSTYPMLKAHGEKEPLGVIHFDSHGDTCSNFGGTRVSDATFLQAAVTDGVVDPERTIQIGLRGRGLVRCEFSHQSGMRVVHAEEFFKKRAKVIAEEAKLVVGNRPCYITIDTDVFDCSVMPGTTLPEPFGLSGLDVRDLLRGLRGALNIAGMDIMELSPLYDPTGMSGCLASGIAFEMLCLLAESRAAHNRKNLKTHW